MADGYVLGIDFGLKHIGVAVGQTVTQTANGLVTIRAKNGNPDWSEFEQLLTQYRPLAVIVGLPLNMDGTSSEMSDRATAFAQALAKRCQSPVFLADERLSSWAVRDDADLEGKDIHTRSACLIAQIYLADSIHCTPVDSHEKQST